MLGVQGVSVGVGGYFPVACSATGTLLEIPEHVVRREREERRTEREKEEREGRPKGFYHGQTACMAASRSMQTWNDDACFGERVNFGFASHPRLSPSAPAHAAACAEWVLKMGEELMMRGCAKVVPERRGSGLIANAIDTPALLIENGFNSTQIGLVKLSQRWVIVAAVGKHIVGFDGGGGQTDERDRKELDSFKRTSWLLS